MKQFIHLIIIMQMAFLSGLPLLVPGQQAEPAWFIVFEEKPVQGDRVQFFRIQKKAVDVWKQYFPEVPVYAWQSDDHIVYRLIPVTGFASMDTLHQKMVRVSEILRASGRLPDNSQGSLYTVSGSVMVRVPELSHHPGLDLVSYSDRPYTEWMFAYLVSGQEQQAEQALQRFKNYYSENKLDYPWDTFRVLFGKDTPVLIGRFQAESAAALKAKGEKIWEKHGAELDRLWEQVVQHTWKIENKTGWFNPSLSNLPVVSPVEEIVNSE